MVPLSRGPEAPHLCDRTVGHFRAATFSCRNIFVTSRRRGPDQWSGPRHCMPFGLLAVAVPARVAALAGLGGVSAFKTGRRGTVFGGLGLAGRAVLGGVGLAGRTVFSGVLVCPSAVAVR